MNEEYIPGLVSAIITTYNRADIVTEAMDSVWEQTYRPVELIVVDDGSSDDTAQQVKQWSKAHPNDEKFELRYVRQENRGGNAARNSGIMAGRGEFAAFLDDDDRWLPEKLEKQIPIFSRGEQIGGVYCGTRPAGKDPNSLRRSYPTGWLLGKLLIRDDTAATSAYVIRRRCFSNAGMFDEDLKKRRDWDMWIRLSFLYRIDAVPEVLVEQGQPPGPRTSLVGVQKALAAEDAIFRKYAGVRRCVAFWRRLAARSALYAARGDIWFHRGDDRVRGIAWHLRSILAWPFSLRSYLALARMLLSAGARRSLRRVASRCLRRLHITERG